MWRQGNKIKLNVYKNDTPMFQCHTPEQAEEIVELLNIGEFQRNFNVNKPEKTCPRCGSGNIQPNFVSFPEIFPLKGPNTHCYSCNFDFNLK